MTTISRTEADARVKKTMGDCYIDKDDGKLYVWFANEWHDYEDSKDMVFDISAQPLQDTSGER